MKVGTDGVLLGAWAGVRPSDRRILDVGTGTGLIALMMAQRAPEALITGVDVEEVSQARENAAASPWGGRVVFEQCPVQEFAPDERFDLILSNPPFFVDSLTCPDEGRTTALIDSPGFQEFGLRHLAPTDLARCMPDIAAHAGTCRFYNCTHLHEPGCAVIAQVREGQDAQAISPQRYRIYGELFAELSQSGY